MPAVRELIDRALAEHPTMRELSNMQRTVIGIVTRPSRPSSLLNSIFGGVRVITVKVPLASGSLMQGTVGDEIEFACSRLPGLWGSDPKEGDIVILALPSGGNSEAIILGCASTKTADPDNVTQPTSPNRIISGATGSGWMGMPKGIG